MAKAALVIMAAGMGSRYGGNKQVDGVGPHGELLRKRGRIIVLHLKILQIPA